MLDSKLRPLIDPPLHHLARGLSRIGVSANAMTLFGLGCGLSAALAIYSGAHGVALFLILASRLADGLDGPIARQDKPDAFGAYLDISCDFVFYAAIPLAFGLANPEHAPAALLLLASFILSGTSFLVSAAIAETMGLTNEAQGKKGFFYLEGLVEGAETIMVFCAMCLFPHWYSQLAVGFALLCVLTALARGLRVYKMTRMAP